MTDTFMALAVGLLIVVAFLLPAFLGAFTASCLEKLTQKLKKVQADVDDGKSDTDDSREIAAQKKSDQ
jgi:predicted Na+-dependent transporter